MVPPAVVSPFSRPAEAPAPPHERSGRAVSCRIASTPDEVAIHMQIRREIFVSEQKFFDQTDRDRYDDLPATVHVLGLHGSVAGGAVRLYPLDKPGYWKGDRLAVLAEYRKVMMGAALVRFAVKTAGERGGDFMIAHVQPQNVRFFRHLGWSPLGDLEQFHGHLHQKMIIPLQPAIF